MPVSVWIGWFESEDELAEYVGWFRSEDDEDVYYDRYFYEGKSVDLPQHPTLFELDANTPSLLADQLDFHLLSTGHDGQTDYETYLRPPHEIIDDGNRLFPISVHLELMAILNQREWERWNSVILVFDFEFTPPNGKSKEDCRLQFVGVFPEQRRYWVEEQAQLEMVQGRVENMIGWHAKLGLVAMLMGCVLLGSVSWGIVWVPVMAYVFWLIAAGMASDCTFEYEDDFNRAYKLRRELDIQRKRWKLKWYGAAGFFAVTGGCYYLAEIEQSATWLLSVGYIILMIVILNLSVEPHQTQLNKHD